MYTRLPETLNRSEEETSKYLQVVIPELAQLLGLKIEDKYCKIWGQETLKEEEKEELEEAIMSLCI